jgi:predicted HicB family RNase H-like nuclease
MLTLTQIAKSCLIRGSSGRNQGVQVLILDVLEGAKKMMDATPQLSEQLTQVSVSAESQMPDRVVPTVPADRRQQFYRAATELYGQKPDWATFFRKVLGTDGLARQLFPSVEQMAELERSPEYAEVQQMLAKLRSKSTPPPDDSEPTRVITVRLPKSLHESLRSEAHDRRTSMNKLCISKLLQMVDNQLVPVE